MTTYEEAAKLVAEHAPDLLLDPNVPGRDHILLRKTEDGPPHSIMLPVLQGDTEREKEILLAAIEDARRML